MNALTSVKKVVDFLLNWVMVITFFLIFAVVLVQIFYRYILNSPLVWSEELSRFIFIWVSLMGWALATRSGTHIRITFIHERLSLSVQKSLTLFFRICTLGFLITLVWLGIDMSSRTFGRFAVAIPQIPVGMFYAALPISAALCIFYVIYDILNPATAKDEPAIME